MVLTLVLALAVAQTADLQLVSEFTRAGKRTFRELVWQEKTRTFASKLIKPDDGQAGVFIFKKTLHFARVVEDGGLR